MLSIAELMRVGAGFVDTKIETEYTLSTSPKELSMKNGVCMKTNSFLLIMVFVAAAAFAQTAQPPAPAPAPAAPSDASKPLGEVLAFMVGNWEGDGVARGEHEFVGKMVVTSELENDALLLRRESMNKSGGPSGGLQELMIIGYDGTTKKIVGTLYDNKSNIALYIGEITDNQLVLNRTAIAEGYIDRRTVKLTPDGVLSFVAEYGAPGKPVSKMVEINFKKKM